MEFSSLKVIRYQYFPIQGYGMFHHQMFVFRPLKTNDNSIIYYI